MPIKRLDACFTLLGRGQIEGGVAQAIGYAIYEKVRYQDGHMINNQMTNYIMPTALDVPDITSLKSGIKTMGQVARKKLAAPNGRPNDR